MLHQSQMLIMTASRRRKLCYGCLSVVKYANLRLAISAASRWNVTTVAFFLHSGGRGFFRCSISSHRFGNHHIPLIVIDTLLHSCHERNNINPVLILAYSWFPVEFWDFRHLFWLVAFQTETPALPADSYKWLTPYIPLKYVFYLDTVSYGV